MLDEALRVLDAAWSGAPVHHHGEHYVVDDLTFLPRPAHRIPVWVAGFPGSARPRRRAATRDGFFPVNLEHPDELAAAVDGLDLPDIVVALPAGTDVTPFAEAGATWWLTDFDPEKITVDEVRGVLRDGPA